MATLIAFYDAKHPVALPVLEEEINGLS